MEFPRLPEADEIRIAEAFHLLKGVSDRIWSGWGEGKAAICLIKREFEYFIGHPNPPDTSEFLYHSRRLDSDISVQQRTQEPSLRAAFPLSGMPTVVIGDPQGTGLTSSRWVLILLHELFHVFQMEQGEFAKTVQLNSLARGDRTGMWQINFPFPYEHEGVKEGIQRLAMALFEMLQARPVNLPNRLKGYLATRKQFQQFMRKEFHTDDYYRYMAFQEWKEGAAKYTEIMIAKLAATTAYAPLRDYSGLPTYERYELLWEYSYKNWNEELLRIGPKGLSRSDFYFLGAAQCFLLDLLDRPWKGEYFQVGLWLDDILREASHR